MDESDGLMTERLLRHSIPTPTMNSKIMRSSPVNLVILSIGGLSLEI